MKPSVYGYRRHNETGSFVDFILFRNNETEPEKCAKSIKELSQGNTRGWSLNEIGASEPDRVKWLGKVKALEYDCMQVSCHQRSSIRGLRQAISGGRKRMVFKKRNGLIGRWGHVGSAVARWMEQVTRTAEL